MNANTEVVRFKKGLKFFLAGILVVLIVVGITGYFFSEKAASALALISVLILYYPGMGEKIFGPYQQPTQ